MSTRPKPTESELRILNILWKHGSCTVRQVFEELNATRETGYTTVLKLMQIMLEKQLVIRDESQRTHIYRARGREEITQNQLLRDLINRAFGGSTEKLVMRALSTKKTSREDLDRIRAMLDDYEREIE